MKKCALFALSLVISFTCFAGIQRAQLSKTVIGLIAPDSLKNDTLELVLFGHDYLDFRHLNERSYKSVYATAQNGVFDFRFTIEDSIGYFLIKLKSPNVHDDILFKQNLIESGDHVTIDISKPDQRITGNGADKIAELLAFKSQFRSVKDSLMKLMDIGSFANENLYLAYYNLKLSEKCLDFWLYHLEKKRVTLSDNAYGLIKTEIASHIQRLPLLLFNVNISINHSYSAAEIQQILAWTGIFLKDLKGKVDPDLLSLSDQWIVFEQNYALFLRNTGKIDGVIDYFWAYPAGKLKDKLLTSTLFTYYMRSGQADSLFRMALNLVTNAYFREELNHYMDGQTIGHIAPEFALLDGSGRQVLLSDFKGKVVFLDFWFIGCKPCKIYHKNAIEPAIRYFIDDPSVVFLSICIEKDKEKWTSGIEKTTLHLQNNIELFTGAAGWEHPTIKVYGVNGAPMPILIDKQGTIFTRDFNELGRKDPKELVRSITKCLLVK